MKLKTTSLAALAAALTASSHAATIVWGTATNISGDLDVSTTGTFVYAEHWGGADNTVNGVAFSAAQNNVVASGSVGVNGNIGAPGSLSAAYQDILKGNWYQASGQTATLNNLTSGHQYQSQVWVADGRYGNTQNTIITGGPRLLIKQGQYAKGTFVADATSQSIAFTGADGIVNAIQVRDISASWSGTTNGVWADSDTSSSNFSGLSFSAAKAQSTVAVFGDNTTAGGTVSNYSLTVGTGGASTGTVVFENTIAHDYTIGSADSNGITGATAINKTGNGTVTLTGSNTYTGATTISAGTLQIGDGGATGSLSTSSAISNNGNFTINRNNAVAQGTDFSGSAITGSGSFTQAGTGTTTLTAANTYTGTTTISAGTLQIGNGGATGSLYSPTVSGGATPGNLTFGSSGAIVNNSALIYNIAGGAVNVNKTISGTGTLSVTGNQSVNFADGTSISTGGSQTYSATATSGRYYGFNLADNATVTLTSTAGDISMTGYLGTANGPTGNLVINTNTGNGNVTLNTPAAISSVDYGLNALTVNAGTGTITLGTYNGQDWNTVNTISLTGGAINSTANLTTFTTLTVTNSAASAFNGSLTASGGALVKEGTGTLTLASTNTYSGATTVSGGTLKVTGSIANSAVTVSNAGTVLASGTSGTIGKSVTVNNSAILAAGGQSAIGSLVLDGSGTAGTVLDMASGSIFDWDLSGTGGTSDQVNFWNYTSSDLALNGNTVNLNLAGTKANGTYTVDLFKFYSDSGTSLMASGITSGLTLGTLGSGISTASFNYNTNTIGLTYTVVPEPTSALAGLLITAGLLRRRRA